MARTKSGSLKLITPAEIRNKAQQLWDSGRVLQDSLGDHTLFPWQIPFRKPSAQMQAEQFQPVRQWISDLQQGSYENKGRGYHLECRETSHRQLGQQLLPAKICFWERDDLLDLIGKQAIFQQVYQLAQDTQNQYPALTSWLQRYPLKLLNHLEVWQSLLAVCAYFIANPRPGRYLRELDIPGVDSKFIEQHKAILSELLDQLLPEQAIDQTVSGLRQHGFERRYGLKYDEPLIRFRLLDAALTPLAGVQDFTLPVSQLAVWDIPCERVFITENKVNGLSFPPVSGAIVIFGLGYGVDTLAELPWLTQREMFYWGDIDTHGFSILSRLRHYYPEVQSLLMDKACLQQYVGLCVEEPLSARCQDVLSNLTTAETELYQALQHSHQRLEQERIPLQALYDAWSGLTKPTRT